MLLPVLLLVSAGVSFWFGPDFAKSSALEIGLEMLAGPDRQGRWGRKACGLDLARDDSAVPMGDRARAATESRSEESGSLASISGWRHYCRCPNHAILVPIRIAMDFFIAHENFGTATFAAGCDTCHQRYQRQ